MSVGHPRKALLLGGPFTTEIAAFHESILGRRLQTLCLAVALLVLAWVPADFLLAAESDFVPLLFWRLLLAMCLVALAFALRAGLIRPNWAVVLSTSLQSGLFLAMASGLSDVGAPLLRQGYGLFPFLIVAQIALLPLALLPALIAALPVLLVAAWLVLATGFAAEELLALWLLGVILAMGVFAAVAQLSLFLELRSARWDAAHDPLTGLANRRTLLQRLDAELARSERSGRALSVVIFDLDLFKAINDRFGHHGGDAVLAEAGRLLQGAVRKSDVAARLGGEEFCLLLPEHSAAEAEAMANRIRQLFELSSVASPDGESMHCTISGGIAERQPGERPEAFLSRADQALYQAKAAGRNQVCLAAPAPRRA